MSTEQIAKSIQGIVFDVDGVLTDGRIIYGDAGNETKQFHVRDGASIKLLASKGIAIAIITGRQSAMVSRRAEELGIVHIMQGADSKTDALKALIDNGFPSQDLCAIGDDIQDLQLFNHPSITLRATVADAHPVVLAKADFITLRVGGAGVALELAELILKAQGKWDFD
jgi:3-deoxy-D-manno-octulosonate 8-phosphate phosphatase (KDO 8-P phosphatase)